MTARTAASFASGVAVGMTVIVVLLTQAGRPDPTVYTGGASC